MHSEKRIMDAHLNIRGGGLLSLVKREHGRETTSITTKRDKLYRSNCNAATVGIEQLDHALHYCDFKELELPCFGQDHMKTFKNNTTN
jgi:hypothetical protein